MAQVWPQMIRKVNIMSKYDRGSCCLVEVTHINNPKSFYIRRAHFKEDVQLLEEKGAPMSEMDARIGKRVIYKSKMIGKYIRGHIQFILFRERGIVYNVFAIDYGCKEEKIAHENIFLPKYDIPCQPLAVHCQLYLCEPKGQDFDKEALDAMRFFVGTETAKMTVVAKKLQKLVVVLQTVEGPDDVSTMLGFLNFTIITDADEEDIYAHPPGGSKLIKYKYKDFKVGVKLQVRVLGGDSLDGFYVGDVNDGADTFRQKCKEAGQFVEYCKRQKMQDVDAAVADGRSCGVKVHESCIYKRCIVKHITVPNAKAIVQLVDWGAELEVDYSDIKPVKSPAFARQPADAIFCSSTEDQIWNNGHIEFLHPGWTLMIEIVELGDGVDIPHKVNMSPSHIPFNFL